MNKEKFYITSAIAYTSKKPHIGNTFEIVMTDAIARYKKMLGYDVYFLTGTDEHGQKIQQAAEEMGITPQQYVDKVASEIKDIWNLMGAEYDQFIRTTDAKHIRIVQKIFKKLYDQGDIYKSEYEGLYCVPCESFFTETQITDGICPDCGSLVQKTKEEAYFFKMSKYQDRLMAHIEQNSEFILPKSREKEMVNNFLKPGLQDLCVSRTSFTWGIPVEFDPGHVIYVWIDALSNYITALGYDPDGSSETYKRYWPADMHVIGKDILRFHTIYWPIILMALGEPLPSQILGHPWLLSGNVKMSKSKGNVMYADELAVHFGAEALRFYLLSEMPYAQDGTITYENIINRYNSELANTLGNLVSRCNAMVMKYFDGIIEGPAEKGEHDEDFINTVKAAIEGYKEKMDICHLSEAIDSVFVLLRRSNKYIDETMPWTLAKDEVDRERLKTVLYHLMESIRIAAVLIYPIMPNTSEKILEQIGVADATWENIQKFGGLAAGTKIKGGEALFIRMDEAAKLEEIHQSLAQESAPQEALCLKPEITIEDIAKLDLRIAVVLSAQKVEKSDKLLKLQVDLGGETRQIVSGIAAHYSPEEMVGKRVVLAANLKKAVIRGVESFGMLLAASDNEGKLRLITTDGDIKSGAAVG